MKDFILHQHQYLYGYRLKKHLNAVPRFCLLAPSIYVFDDLDTKLIVQPFITAVIFL